ncbi:hypothetical protein BI364_06890 [Acidihalobacter yilgarnensis]|uniref:Uncharacterized protein n=1 Tax=Acidihalobacter yilgarnensis TaxID=2819280 RepID=A0A1D8IMM4_9GAMM|nr:hypothetical protein [Acidihalobacter yilgarnensis]AOU97720.1 hypothetical protein BI364_06890 [Acidihalobacter yilgarnensis]
MIDPRSLFFDGLSDQEMETLVSLVEERFNPWDGLFRAACDVLAERYAFDLWTPHDAGLLARAVMERGYIDG